MRVNDAAFDAWIAELQPEVVIFDRFMTEEQFGWRVAQLCPGTLRVLDTSDLHCLRKAREQVVLRGGSLDVFNELALREIAAIHRCDLSLMISEYEQALLHEVFGVPQTQIAYWPFFVSLPRTVPGYRERANCIMIGSFLHAPNLDAARWCATAEIWPRVQAALPGLELHLYGSYGDKYAAELHQPSLGIHYRGRADDALQTMQRYRLNLAPLRFGAGLKGKLFGWLPDRHARYRHTDCGGGYARRVGVGDAADRGSATLRRGDSALFPRRRSGRPCSNRASGLRVSASVARSGSPSCQTAGSGRCRPRAAPPCPVCWAHAASSPAPQHRVYEPLD